MSKCGRFETPVYKENGKIIGKPNACSNHIVTYNCTPWNPKIWCDVKVPDGMDPALYNVLNGCWLCNFYTQEFENEYLCKRSFFNGAVRPPCNQVDFISPPANSADEINRSHKPKK